ncbi:MAG: hypothetical protein UGF45_08465, partial [Massilioclostridium sp.]|nr:hypothetical protein [Massilioclostridium sp.]
PLYSEEKGRSSIDPIVLIKMVLRQTVEETWVQDKQLQEKSKVERAVHGKIRRETNMTILEQM